MGHNRRVGHFPVAGIRRLPQNLPGLHVDANHERLSAHRNHSRRTIDQRTLPRVPQWDFGSECLHKIEPPQEPSRIGTDTHHMALGANRQHTVVADCRYRTGHAMIPLDIDIVAPPPDLLPIIQRETTQHIGPPGLIVVEKVNPAAIHNRPGMAFSQSHRPQQRRPGVIPLLSQRMRFPADIVKFRPSETGPAPAYLGSFPAKALKMGADLHIALWPGQGRRPVVHAGRMDDKIRNRIIPQPPSQPGKPEQGNGAHKGPMYGAIPHLAEMS